MKAVQDEKMVKTETPKERIPTQAEQAKFLKDQMPLKRLQVELQRLNTDFVELKVREFEAISKLQQIEQAQHEAKTQQEQYLKDNMIEHTVTQEDMDMNPQMAEAGIVVGQKIGIPKDIYADLNLSNKVDISSPVVDSQGLTQEMKEEMVAAETASPLSVVKD